MLLQSLIIIAGRWELGYEPERRDGQHKTLDLASSDCSVLDSTFSEDKQKLDHSSFSTRLQKKIPFQFTIKMPPPRYYPEILKRDDKGRIITSKFPPLTF